MFLEPGVGTTITSGNYPINFATMVSGGAKFTYMRVSTGMSVSDTQFTSANVAAARSAGLKVGFYHGALPSSSAHSGNGKTIQGATDEANWFCDRVVAIMGTNYGDILPAISWADGSTTWANDDEAYNWLDTFNTIVKQRLGRTVVLATGYYYVDGNITGISVLKHSANGGIGKKMPLWLLATDTGTYPGYGYTVFGEFKDNKWMLWQYSTTGTGSTYGVNTSSVILNYTENLSSVYNPNAPTGLIAVAGDAKITLAWDKATAINVNGYKIYRNGTLVVTTTDKNTAAYEDTGLVNGTTYSYTVSAVTDWQDSPQTSAVTGTPVQPFVSLYPYYPGVTRNETISGNWTYSNDITISGTAIKTTVSNHISNVSNPHSVTKTQIGLDQVDNTSDANKPVSTAVTTALSGKANSSHTHTVSNITDYLTTSSTFTGTPYFQNGYSAGTKVLVSNAVATNYYLRLARVRFTTTYNRAFFDIRIIRTAAAMRAGRIIGFFYNGAITNTLDATSFVDAINDGFNMNWASGEVVYMPADGTTSYVIDIFVQVTGYAKIYENLTWSLYENGATLTLNPDNGTLLTALPNAGDVISVASINHTYGTAVNAIIKTVTMT